MKPLSNGTATSDAAAESLVPHAARLRRRVYSTILFWGIEGCTCDEIEQITGLSHQTASARVHELMASGEICANGRRKTRSGRTAIVWITS